LNNNEWLFVAPKPEVLAVLFQNTSHVTLMVQGNKLNNSRVVDLESLSMLN
jgi:hypothetical protein